VQARSAFGVISPIPRTLEADSLAARRCYGLVGHSVFTVQSLGWAGTKNGDLPNRASGVTDIFVTMDGKLEHQYFARFGISEAFTIG
jgi:hypothetical protein